MVIVGPVCLCFLFFNFVLMSIICRYWPREDEDWASTRRIAGLDEVRVRCGHLQHRIPPCQDIRDGVFDAIIAEAAAARKEGRMVCAK